MTLTLPVIATATEPSEFTEAERQLFVNDHLATLQAPIDLHYATERRGTLQDPINDQATLHLAQESNARVAKVDWMSGTNRIELPPFGDIKGNPIILHFLEREIREMNRLTGGAVNYYRKRIRMALATNPEVESALIDYQGRKITATRITIAPYVDDPARSRYEKFAERRYTLILSDAVPGNVVTLTGELRATAPKPSDGELLWSETVRLDRVN